MVAGREASRSRSEASQSAFRGRKIKSFGSGGIRTHAPEETGALNQRLRPLGHATFDGPKSGLACHAMLDNPGFRFDRS